MKSPIQESQLKNAVSGGVSVVDLPHFASWPYCATNCVASCACVCGRQQNP